MNTNLIEVTWKNLELKTIAGKKILSEVNGQATPGTITAIMGPSGSGKTTLMNSLAGRISDDLVLEGDILVNGRPRDSDTWPGIVSYVSQVFYAFEWQTVYETLEFAALSKLGSNENTVKRIKEVLDMLGLQDSRDTLVERLSGGERMRLSIGVELIGNPPIIFLDEPTSGLDSFNALNILDILKNLSSQGKTIILTIHQPSYIMLERVDKLILMCQGSPLYDGDIDGCIKFFSDCGFELPDNTNPSDFFLDTIAFDPRTPQSKLSSQKTINALKEEWNFMKEEKCPQIFDKINPNLSQKNFALLPVLMKREFVDSIRNIDLLKAKLFQKLFITVLFGFTYFQLGITNADQYSLRGVITFLIINELFGISGPILNKFPQSKRIIERERMSGLYSGYEAYFSKFLVLLMQNLVFELPYVLIVYYLVGLNSNFGVCVIFLIIIVTVLIFSISFALTVSTIAPTADVAQAIGITLNIFFILYSGAFNNPNTIPAVLRWLVWLSPAYYSFRAALQNQLNNVKVNGVPGEEIISKFGLDGIGVWPCILVLLGYSILVQILGAVAMHEKTKNNLKMGKASNSEVNPEVVVHK